MKKSLMLLALIVAAPTSYAFQEFNRNSASQQSLHLQPVIWDCTAHGCEIDCTDSSGTTQISSVADERYNACSAGGSGAQADAFSACETAAEEIGDVLGLDCQVQNQPQSVRASCTRANPRTAC